MDLMEIFHLLCDEISALVRHKLGYSKNADTVDPQLLAAAISAFAGSSVQALQAFSSFVESVSVANRHKAPRSATEESIILLTPKDKRRFIGIFVGWGPDNTRYRSYGDRNGILGLLKSATGLPSI